MEVIEEQRENFHVDSICHQCFSCGELASFQAVNSLYSLNDLLVAMFAVAGCVYMLESVCFLTLRSLVLMIPSLPFLDYIT